MAPRGYPISDRLSLQSSHFRLLAFLEDQRKPRLLARVPGLPRLGMAERRFVPTTCHEPPRRPGGPDAGPVGLTTGLPVGYAAWYQSAVHSHTFPCMSKKPHGLAAYCPTLLVWLITICGTTIPIIIRIRAANCCTPGISRGRSCTTGIFPLRFRQRT